MLMFPDVHFFSDILHHHNKFRCSALPCRLYSHQNCNMVNSAKGSKEICFVSVNNNAPAMLGNMIHIVNDDLIIVMSPGP